MQERLWDRLIRYCDDFVVLCKGNQDRVLKGIKTVLGGLDLDLNEDKTRAVDTIQEKFTFLGFTFMMVKNPKTGKVFPLVRPSKIALKEIRAEVKKLI